MITISNDVLNAVKKTCGINSAWGISRDDFVKLFGENLLNDYPQLFEIHTATIFKSNFAIRIYESYIGQKLSNNTAMGIIPNS